ALAQAGCSTTEERPPQLREAREVTLAYWGWKRMDHERMFKRWDGFRTTLMQFMSRFDLVLTPVAPDIAPMYQTTDRGEHEFSYALPFSLTGNPCVVVRAGTSKEGLPIGVQVVAGKWMDGLALKAAHAIERELGGWRPASVVG
ncbi:MAG TPA: amidase family protein, partial [Candidatus Udaeobacter sp.]|nr:amidase family protein [Candidatus Udaeobacter sp.]